MLAHVGGIQPVIANIDSSPITNLDLGAHGSIIQHPSGRVAPYDTYASTTAMWALYPTNTAAPAPIFSYSATAPAGGSPVTTVAIPFSSNSNVVWKYDSQLHAFQRFYGTTPDTLATGTQNTAANVVVQFVQVTYGPWLENETGGLEVQANLYNSASGTALIFRSGEEYPGVVVTVDTRPADPVRHQVGRPDPPPARPDVGRARADDGDRHRDAVARHGCRLRTDAAFTGRQVHQLVGRHSESGVRKALHRLVGQGTVTARRVGQADVYGLNRDHLAAPYVIALAALRSELLFRMADDLRSWTVRPMFAALFGSAARGDMTEESDIDLLVVRPDTVDIDDGEWRSQLDGFSQRVHRWTGNDARVFELGEEEVRTGLEERARVLHDVRADGLTLFGSRTYLALAGKEQARSDG